jgi:hypothetical protein
MPDYVPYFVLKDFMVGEDSSGKSAVEDKMDEGDRIFTVRTVRILSL